MTLKKVLANYRGRPGKKEKERKLATSFQTSAARSGVYGMAATATSVGSMLFATAGSGSGTAISNTATLGLGIASSYYEGKASVWDPETIAAADTFKEKHPVIHNALTTGATSAVAGGIVGGIATIATMNPLIGIAVGAAASGILGSLAGTAFGSAYVVGKRAGHKEEVDVSV